MRSHEQIKDFIEEQLFSWPLAKKNYDALSDVRRRIIGLGDMETGIQWNPSRIVSTNAKTDAASIAARKCFLCGSNRPQEQIRDEIMKGWDLLVNPYPILPVHLTIASQEHKPQRRLPWDIVGIAESLPGMVVFFNGANAGASAPDHLHLQAVLKSELPLMNLVEKLHDSSSSEIVSSADLQGSFPFLFFSGIVAPDGRGENVLKTGLCVGGDSEGISFSDPGLVNAFFWIDGNTGRLRFVCVPRKAHRPRCFYSSGKDHHLISPGCIDMAGLIITPLEEDFCSLTEEDVAAVYSDVTFSPNY